MNITKEKKSVMLGMMAKAADNVSVLHSTAVEMERYAPKKLSSWQKQKIKDITKKTGNILAKGFPKSKTYVKKNYTQAQWENDCKLVEDILVIGTSKMVAHAQEIKNIVEGEWGEVLKKSLDTAVVPTITLAMDIIRQACDMVNYTGVCLDEAFHDDWDIIVDMDDVVPPKSWEHYKKALEKLDADMRKSYNSKKKNLEKTYGDKIHRAVKPETDYYVEAEKDC